MSTVREEPALPPNHAFVVEFNASTGENTGLSGRVEHVVSGRAARFASAGELLEFVQGILQGEQP